MVLTDADGSESKRGFTLKLLERTTPAEGDRSLIVFDTPADVRGTSVLSHSGGANGDDEQWLYLPSARRTKCIASSNRWGIFVGSEFTFEDLTGNDVRKHSWKLLGKKACGEGSCFDDTTSTEITLGTVLDVIDGSTLARLDASRRFGEHWKLTLAGSLYQGTSGSLQSSFSRDSNVQVRVAYFF